MPVRLISSVAEPPVPARPPTPPAPVPPPPPRALRVVPPAQQGGVSRDVDGPMGLLLDDPWPEYAGLVADQVLPGDTLLVPVAGLGPLRGPAWPNPSGVRLHACSLLHHLRRQELDAQTLPAARVRTRLKYDGLLARAYAGVLLPSVRHLLVSQNLLPHLWEAGALRRRSFDVLMTHAPWTQLNTRVRAAQARHPSNAMLYLHTADSTLADTEASALREARRLYTPHAELADQLGHRVVRLPWVLPAAGSPAADARLVFCGQVSALDGAYEVRALARRTGVPLGLVAPRSASLAFWRGVRVEERPLRSWIPQAGVVVQPAWVCAQPRRLLEAVACGVPVVATEAAGLPPAALARCIPVDNPTALAEALDALGVMPPTG